MGSNASTNNVDLQQGPNELGAPPPPSENNHDGLLDLCVQNRKLRPGEPATVDFIFAGAERTGKTTLKAEIQAAVTNIEHTLTGMSATMEFKFFELPCDWRAAGSLEMTALHLSTAHFVYVFLLTDFSSPVSLEKLHPIFDSLAPAVDAAQSKQWWILVNKYDLPEEERQLKLVDFADLITSNETLRAAKLLKTSLMPPTKHNLNTIIGTIIDDITLFARRMGALAESEKHIPDRMVDDLILQHTVELRHAAMEIMK